MYVAGVDLGSLTAKAVIIKDGKIAASHVMPAGYNSAETSKKVMEECLKELGLSIDDLAYTVSTGYGRINVPFADKQITEITCHAKGAAHFFPEAKTIIDIGGQDSKAIKIQNGRPIDFVMNDKCAAGTGRYLEVTADALGIPIEQMGPIALGAKNPAQISNICTVFAEQEVVARLAEGVPLDDLVAGILESLASRISRMVNRLKAEEELVITGGGAKNVGLVTALSEKLGCAARVPPEPLLTGAVGAALLGKDMVEKALKHGLPLEKKERSLKEISLY